MCLGTEDRTLPSSTSRRPPPAPWAPARSGAQAPASLPASAPAPQWRHAAGALQPLNTLNRLFPLFSPSCATCWCVLTPAARALVVASWLAPGASATWSLPRRQLRRQLPDAREPASHFAQMCHFTVLVSCSYLCSRVVCHATTHLPTCPPQPPQLGGQRAAGSGGLSYSAIVLARRHVRRTLLPFTG